jgi:hypothetical protein
LLGGADPTLLLSTRFRDRPTRHYGRLRFQADAGISEKMLIQNQNAVVETGCTQALPRNPARVSTPPSPTKGQAPCLSSTR